MKVRYGKGWSIDVQILKSIGVDLEELEAFESPGLWRAVARRFRLLYSPYRVGILYNIGCKRGRAAAFLTAAEKCIF